MISPLKLLPVVAPFVGGGAVLAWRIRETRTPVTVRKIVIPPLGMSTGFFMFVRPEMRIPWALALAAFLVGALILSVPLERSSSLERQGDVVMMRRSNGFLVILLGLLALRLLLHDYVGHLLPPLQTGALFFVLAFGMISRWRAAMYLKYRRLMAGEKEADAAAAEQASGD
ncbi:MAG TPA: cytochrome c biogenesis protein CcdC [Longimicrobiales bacterium]|nr:cytochrome c biogenesis protein CcdC [Longimicrobiales bacterium]